MSSLVQVGWMRSSRAVACLSIGVLLSSAAMAGDGASAGACQGPRLRKNRLPHYHASNGATGFQGFGLGYHLGYGYGGDGLGVGCDGGYPFYGGPGYPHPAPCLRRCGGITPFPFYGGPGFPTASNPNFFGAAGPLVISAPVIEIDREPEEAEYTSSFGGFTGTLPYPDSYFAPFTSVSGGSSSGANPSFPAPAPPNLAPTDRLDPPSPTTPPANGATSNARPAVGSLGVVVEPVVDAQGERGIKVAMVYHGTAAEKSGLRRGDVIRSTNGYVTAQAANLDWILKNAAPDRVFNMSVRNAGDGKERKVTTLLP
jgi:PDZ domain